jgi:hypothetical protein
MDDPQRKKPADEDIENKPEQEKNLDRDGRERQPPDQSERK